MKDLITEARELATENISQPTVFYKDKSQRIMLRLCDALEKERGVMCYYRTDDGKCRKFTDDKYTSYCVDGPCPDETPTNADRIRSMSDEELADWIDSMLNQDREDWDVPGCYSCINFGIHHSDPQNKGTNLYECADCPHEGSHENGLKHGVLSWLRQPVDEADTLKEEK